MTDEELERIEAYLSSLKDGSRLTQTAYALLAEVCRLRRENTALEMIGQGLILMRDISTED